MVWTAHGRSLQDVGAVGRRPDGVMKVTGLNLQRELLLAGRLPNEIDRATLRRVRASTSPGGEFQKASFLMMTG